VALVEAPLLLAAINEVLAHTGACVCVLVVWAGVGISGRMRVSGAARVWMHHIPYNLSVTAGALGP
jgi:hypothetical protein